MIDWKTISIEDLACYLASELKRHEIEVVLVGGACVTIHSNNEYMSSDLDFISYDDMSNVKGRLESLGMVFKNNYFKHPDCPFWVEFVPPPVAISNEVITEFSSLERPCGSLRLLTPIDTVKDRLSAYFYWDDIQSLDQAVSVYKAKSVDMAKLQLWAKGEGQEEKFAHFTVKLKAFPEGSS